MMFSKDIEEVNSEESMSLSDGEADELLPGDKVSQKSNEDGKKKQKNKAV